MTSDNLVTKTKQINYFHVQTKSKTPKVWYDKVKTQISGASSLLFIYNTQAPICDIITINNCCN